MWRESVLTLLKQVVSEHKRQKSNLHNISSVVYVSHHFALDEEIRTTELKQLTQIIQV